MLLRSHNSWVSGGSDFTLKTSFCPHLVSSRPSLKSAFKVYEGTHTSFQVSPITTPAGHQLGFGGNSLKVRTPHTSTLHIPPTTCQTTLKRPRGISLPFLSVDRKRLDPIKKRNRCKEIVQPTLSMSHRRSHARAAVTTARCRHMLFSTLLL